jgi:signal transduction histidine kinase
VSRTALPMRGAPPERDVRDLPARERRAPDAAFAGRRGTTSRPAHRVTEDVLSDSMHSDDMRSGDMRSRGRGREDAPSMARHTEHREPRTVQRDRSERPSLVRERRGLYPRGRWRRGRALTEEERIYREAERRARRKLGFLRHLIVFVFVSFFLLVVSRRAVALVPILLWGIGLSMHFVSAMIGPGLRDRWLRSEVEQQVRRRVTSERRVLEGEKTRSLEELSASIAHEIRNPITAAKSLVQQMAEDPASPDNAEYATVALQELERVERSISHLLRYGREDRLTTGVMPLGDAVKGALETLRERTRRLGADVHTEIEPGANVLGDAEKLRRVFINLVGNALDAFEEAATEAPSLDIDVGVSLAGTEVWARVRDNGPGMDAETLGKVFRPFYTSKANGTGLGLAISRKLIEAHRGTIEIESEVGRGTELVITFPRAEGDAR